METEALRVTFCKVIQLINDRARVKNRESLAPQSMLLTITPNGRLRKNMKSVLE